MEKSLKEILDEILDEVQKELDEATTTGNVDGYQTPYAFSKGNKHKKRKKKIATQLGYSVVGGDIDNINEARIKGRNNKTGESFGMVIGSDKQGNNGYELTVRKMYNSRISSYGFIFDKDSNLTEIRDYGYSLDGKFPDMKGHASSTSVRPNKRENITQIAKITSPAFAKKIYQHVQKNNKMNESVNEAKVKRPVNRWLELKNDETMHPHKKMAMGLKELKYQLRETEKFFNWYNKIKTMNELDSNQYWKRTNKHIYSIKEKLINIAKTIQEIEK